MTPDLWTYRAALVRIIDGDTAVFRLDMGFRVSCEQSLRLIGVNAPELFTGTDREVGAQAKQDCADWLSSKMGYGIDWPFIVTTQKDRQTFGRFLGTIYALDGTSLNDHLASMSWQQTTP